MNKYKIHIIPNTFIGYGKNEEEAIKNVLGTLKEFKEFFVVEEVEEENGED